MAGPSSRATSVVTHGLARKILAQPGIEGDPLAFLDVSEAYWRALRNQKHEPHKKGPTVVRYAPGKLNDFVPPVANQWQQIGKAPSAQAQVQPQGAPHDYDVVICGGTLGLFLATALQTAGWRVAIVEKRLVQGRNQEWNISWGELQILSDLGLLTVEQLRACVVSAFNPIRTGFLGGEDKWTRGVLNLGVQPRMLLDALRQRFVAAGGVLYENTAFKGATIYEDGLRLTLSLGGRDAPLAVGDTNRPNGLEAPNPAGSRPRPAAPRSMTCRLLLDCMGHYSDIVKQIRGRVKPDGMCLVVGSCAEGFPPEKNTDADLLYSLTNVRDDMQLFWEAFPAEGGSARTTYMFAYSDPHPERPSFEKLLDTYFELLPQYQGLPVDQLRFKRVLFGGFPCYSNGPLQPAFDRVMQIGDASASQSPLSFGGFGNMMRHLGRLSRALGQALKDDRLKRADLAWVQPYQPSLSASWLFQRSMSVAVGQVAYPPGYEFVPEHIAAAERMRQEAAAAAEAEAEAAALVGLVGGASTAGISAALEAAMRLSTAGAERFASGSIDPDDYFHEEEEEMVEGPTTTMVASQMKSQAQEKQADKLQQQQEQQQRPATHERDLRDAPGWAKLPYTHVNEILATNFGVMAVLGDRVLKPFLQDTIQLIPLSLSMTGMLIANPIVISRVLLQVGPETLAAWFGHYFALVAYSLGYSLLSPLRSVVPAYDFQRLLDALEYGSGSDYRYHADGDETHGLQEVTVESAAAAMAAAKAKAAAKAAAVAVQAPAGAEGDKASGKEVEVVGARGSS